ncbi:MAG TPA: hypothetical protein QF602_07565, partial [Candidatus Marinimicrobia bacterium]|nr:hypothetical protein [Candidatus Neomarinimicrobiota bacterium]
MNTKNSVKTAFILLIISQSLLAQREYIVHDRGMLHESVFNNGILSQPLKNNGIEWSAQPMFEWPGRSNTIVEGVEYDGQHNSLGGGIHIAVNYPGSLGYNDKKFAFCGMIGDGGPETSVGVWTFPISFYEVRNYPLLDDGSLNPDFDPNEAEQIIYAKWATSVGLTVQRTTRSYSYPDYDDIVLHEYEFEFTGNTDMDPTTIEMDTVDTLVDVLIYFAQSFAPSMYGYQRHYNEWKWKPGIFQGDNWASFDPDYWLAFNMDCETGGDFDLAGKPEPTPELFQEFASSGENGGGFASPAAVGYTMLYYDQNHLTVFDGPDSTSVNSEYGPTGQELDDQFRLKQPYHTYLTHGWFSSAVIMANGRPHLRMGPRANGFYNETEIEDWGLNPAWVGRAQFKHSNSDYPGRSFAFGPYTLSKGDTLEYSFAQVAGYGADATKQYWGGHQKDDLWGTVPSMNRRVVIDGQVITENYIDDYGYPDYVNSDVITVNDVARKAWEAYTGQVIPHDSTWADGELVCWPENNSKDGNYAVPIPYPAPGITVETLDDASVRLRWGRAVESFTHAAGNLEKFNVYRSIHPIGPWKLLNVTVAGAIVDSLNLYEMIDDDIDFKVGDFAFYAVTSINDLNMESGKTNITRIQKNIGAVAKMGKVYVVPNPFVLNSGFSGTGTED